MPRRPYSPDELYTNLADGKHAAVIHFRLDINILAEITKLVEGRTVREYETMSHFFRDAVIHRLHYVENNTPSLRLSRLLSELEVSHVLLRAEQQQATFDKTMVEAGNLLAQLISRGTEGRQRARVILEELLVSVSNISDPYWRGQAQDYLSQFAYLRSATP